MTLPPHINLVDSSATRHAIVCRACHTWMIRLDDRLPEFVPAFLERHAHRQR